MGIDETQEKAGSVSPTEYVFHPFDLSEILSTDYALGENTEISSADTLIQAQKYAQDLSEEYLKDHDKPDIWDMESIKSVAEFINTKFPFTNKIAGIATFASQLKKYEEIIKDPATDPSKAERIFDCKMPTFMAGFVLKCLSEELKLTICTPNIAPHPHLLIQIPSGKVFDLHYVNYIERKTSPSYPKITEYPNMAEHPSNSRNSDINNLDIEGLSFVDQLFIES